MTKFPVLFGSIAIAACGRAAVVVPVAAAPRLPMLELGEITLLEGETPMMKIHADGTTELAVHVAQRMVMPASVASADAADAPPIVWEPGPTLKTDGMLAYHDSDVARIISDGTILDLVTQETLPLVITDRRMSFYARGQAITVDLTGDGTLAFRDGRETSAWSPHVTGADTAGKRRAVLTLLALTVATGDAHTLAVDARADAGSASAAPR